MTRHGLKLGCSVLALSALGACSDSKKKDEMVVVPPQSGPSQLSSFGTQFATAYRADPNSDPYTPADGDVLALTLTADPVSID